MDRSSPFAASSRGRDASSPADPAAAASGMPAEAASIEREIEALKAFLARYPLAEPDKSVEPPQPDPTPIEPAADVATAPEIQPQAYSSSAAGRSRVWFLATRRRKVIAGVVLGAVLLAVALAGLPFRSSVSESPRMGRLSVATTPSGMAVVIDGVPRSVTPVTVDLAPGDHVLEVVTGSERRRIPVTIAPGGQVSHYFEIATPPLTVAEPPATPRVAPVPTAGSSDPAAAGWVSVTAGADVQVLENGRLLGSSRVDRIMLPAGRHDLEFVNEVLGYRTVQTVHVPPGDVVPVRLRWPQGTVALNAVPWAEVLVDGQPVGETPIGGLTLPIGVHEVVFRHPELGERRASVTVTMGKTTTLGVDLGVK